jgi:hypothetical protein
MASSTTMPSVTMKANIVIMLIENGVADRKRKEPRKEIGIPMLTQKARRISRKMARRMMTRPNPRNAFRSRRLARCSKTWELSRAMESWSSPGSSWFSRSMTRLDAWATWMGVWSPTRKTCREIERLPLKVAQLEDSSNPWLIVAMSSRSTRLPSGLVITGSAAYSSTVVLRSLTRTRMSPPSVRRDPPPMSTEASAILAATSPRVSP